MKRKGDRGTDKIKNWGSAEAGRGESPKRIRRVDPKNKRKTKGGGEKKKIFGERNREALGVYEEVNCSDLGGAMGKNRKKETLKGTGKGGAVKS